MGRSDWTYREESGKRIPGQNLTAFIHNGGIHFLTEITVYQDGMIDCWELVNFEKFKRKVAKGWVVTTLPEGANVSVGVGLAQFTATKVSSFVDEAEFIKEVADVIEELNSRPTSSIKCKQAYKAYQQNPTEETRALLQQAYESIPEHNRRYVLGDMDVKDVPIRMIIYGDEEIENWSHWQVAQSMGEELPSITIPKVKPKENPET